MENIHTVLTPEQMERAIKSAQNKARKAHQDAQKKARKLAREDENRIVSQSENTRVARNCRNKGRNAGKATAQLTKDELAAKAKNTTPADKFVTKSALTGKGYGEVLAAISSTKAQFEGRVQQAALHCIACAFDDGNTTPMVRLFNAMGGTKQATHALDYIVFMLSSRDNDDYERVAGSESLVSYTNTKEKGLSIKFTFNSRIKEAVADTYPLRKRTVKWNEYAKAKKVKTAKSDYELFTGSLQKLLKKVTDDYDCKSMSKHEKADIREYVRQIMAAVK